MVQQRFMRATSLISKARERATTPVSKQTANRIEWSDSNNERKGIGTTTPNKNTGNNSQYTNEGHKALHKQ